MSNKKNALAKSLSVSSAILDAIFSFLFAAVIDSILSRKSFLLLFFTCAIILFIQSEVNCAYERLYCIALQSQMSKLLQEYFSAPYAKQDGERLTQIFDRDLPNCLSYELSSHPILITEIPIILALFLVIFYNSAVMAMSVLLLALIEISLPLLFSKFFEKNYEKTAALEEKIEHFYYVVFNNIKKCWFFPTNYLSGRLRRWNEKYFVVGAASEKTAALYNELQQIISISIQFGLYVIGALLIKHGTHSFSDIMSIIYVGGKLLSSASKEAELIKSKSSYRISKARINEIYGNLPVFSFLCNDILSISIHNFQTKYTNKTISICIQQRQLWLFKGKNGSGKSTLANALMNFLPDYTGEILINGTDIHQLDMREFVYYVPQDSVDIDLTAQQLLEFASLDMITSLFEAFLLPRAILRQPINSLSGGEQKKVLLICALLSKKPVLILDEPETTLDFAARCELRNQLRNCAQTVLILTSGTEFDTLPHQEVHV